MFSGDGYFVVCTPMFASDQTAVTAVAVARVENRIVHSPHRIKQICPKQQPHHRHGMRRRPRVPLDCLCPRPRNRTLKRATATHALLICRAKFIITEEQSSSMCYKIRIILGSVNNNELIGHNLCDESETIKYNITNGSQFILHFRKNRDVRLLLSRPQPRCQSFLHERNYSPTNSVSIFIHDANITCKTSQIAQPRLRYTRIQTSNCVL